LGVPRIKTQPENHYLRGWKDFRIYPVNQTDEGKWREHPLCGSYLSSRFHNSGSSSTYRPTDFPNTKILAYCSEFAVSNSSVDISFNPIGCEIYFDAVLRAKLRKGDNGGALADAIR